MRATDKPFNIDKKLVYEAYKAVKSNAGAARAAFLVIQQFSVVRRTGAVAAARLTARRRRRRTTVSCACTDGSYGHRTSQHRSWSRCGKYMSRLCSVRGAEGIVVVGEGVVIHSAIPSGSAVETFAHRTRTHAMCANNGVKGRGYASTGDVRC